MVKKLTKLFLVVVFLSAGSANGSLKYYRYNGNLPFIEMMLNMMTVMGVLDKVPYNYASGLPYGAFPGSNYGARAYPFNSTGRFGQYSGWLNTVNDVNGLNGLWASENGEMLGINKLKFLWNDANQRYLKGTLQLNNGLMFARINGLNQQISFQYRLQYNQLLVRDQNGVVKVFEKIKFGDLFKFEPGAPINQIPGREPSPYIPY